MYRFTIRDVLWLTVVVALALGWWLERDNARRMIKRKGETVHRMAQKLADETNRSVHVSDEAGEYIVAPVIRPWGQIRCYVALAAKSPRGAESRSFAIALQMRCGFVVWAWHTMT